MSFGLQAFKSNGAMSFDSEKGAMRILDNRRITGPVSFTVNSPPPYSFIINVEDNYTSGWQQLNFPEHVTVTNSGNTISVHFKSEFRAVRMPATIWVIK